MSRVIEFTEITPQPETLAFSALAELYDQTIDELSQCADINPGEDEFSEETDVRENALLDLEAHLLDQAAILPIQTESDVAKMLSLWRKVSSLDSSEAPNISDRLAMNIFRYLVSDCFNKD